MFLYFGGVREELCDRSVVFLVVGVGVGVGLVRAVMCPCGHGVTAMASASAAPALQLHSRLCALPSTIPPSLLCSRILHPPNSASARCSWSRISSPLLATPREDVRSLDLQESSSEHHHLASESSTNGSANGVVNGAAAPRIGRVPQGGANNLGISHNFPSNGAVNGNVKFQDKQELESGRHLVEEILFTQEFLDTLDYDSYSTARVLQETATHGGKPTTSPKVVAKLDSVASEKLLRPKLLSTDVVKSVRKKGRVLPASIAEVLPLKPGTSIKFYIDLYASLLKAGRIKDCLVLLGEINKLDKLSLMKVNHSKFYEVCKTKGTVEDAFTFAKIMRVYSTLQHYTMLLSVCCHAKDIDGALRVLALVESRGFKADCVFYTTLISACSKAGKVDLLFQILHEMDVAGVEANVHTFGAMIDGCARAGQLPKAFGAYGIMISKDVKPDRVIFNTLINACSRVGAVQRAFDVLADMKSEATPVKPDHVTYGALISACAKGGEVGRALEVYQSMRENDVKGFLACYTAAVHACSQKGDLDYALAIYDDLLKDGVKPDEVFFSALVDAAGHSGDVDKAFSILDIMRKSGMKPGAVVYSSLMGVCSNLGEWEKGLEVYEGIRSSKLRPTVSTYNALMTALCEAKQFDRALSVLNDLKDAGRTPNQVSYSILLKACEREGKADMALDLYTTARAEGIKPNLVICDSIIGLCLQQIQTSVAAPLVSWSILPPADNSNISSQQQWVTWALTIYRQTIEAGVLPTVEILSQLLGCLRKPEASTTPVSIFDDKAAAFLGQSQPATSTSFDGFGIYDPRALALFEEAAALKIAPMFSYNTLQPIVINAEAMPVFAAEVCLLTVLKSLKHRHAAGARVPSVKIKLHVEKKESYRPKGGLISINIADRTGQAVAALLRRLRLKAQGSASSGELRLTMVEIQKWLNPKPSTTPALKTPFSRLDKSSSPYSLLAKTIADQQRAIRLGTAAPHHRVLDVLTDMDLRQGGFHQEDFCLGPDVGPRGRGSLKRSSRF